MNRRDLFKAIGTLVGGAALAPLAKFLPQPRPPFVCSREESMRIGSMITIRKPARYVRHEFSDRYTFSSSDLALSIDDFADRYIKPSIEGYINAGDQWEDG